MAPTELDPSSTTQDPHEKKILESLSDIHGKVNTNVLLSNLPGRLRVIAINTDTYDSLMELAGSGKTYDDILRKCLQAYKKEKEMK